MPIKLLNETEERLMKYFDDNQNELFNQLSELVKIDTVNHRTYGNENQGQDYLEKICRDSNLKIDRFTPESIPNITEHRDYLPGRSADKRENLVAIVEGEDSTKNVLLAGHIDTELVGDLDRWTDDPFSGIIRDGKIYGRGVGDDKSGVIAAWFVLKAFKDLGIVPKKNLLMGAYCDEEGGGGNGALALALKYPSDLCVNLDSSGIETMASGGGCFRLTIKSVSNNGNVASVFDVHEGVNLVVGKLAELNKRPKTKIRLSNTQAGIGQIKEGVINLAIYADMTKEQCEAYFNKICVELKDDFDRLGLVTDGFVLMTRFFIYGETVEDSKELQILRDLMREETGKDLPQESKCLSDLSLLMAYCTKNSFNYGVPVGSSYGGGPHQPNEHISCDDFLKFTKKLGLLLLRM